MVVDRRIKDAVDEVLTKASKAEVNEIRLYFDSQLTTEQENNRERCAMLSEMIKDETEERGKEDRKIREEAVKNWATQNKQN